MGAIIGKLENKRGLIFSYMHLVRRIEKYRDRKFICLVEKKKRNDEKWSLNKITIMSVLNKTKNNTFFI